MTQFNQFARVSAIAMVSVFLLGNVNPLAAQAMGTITGTVTASESGGPLAGAQVNVQGTVRRTVTDAQGRYRISIEEGSYTVQVNTLGRTNASSMVSVMAGGTSGANFSLASSSVAIGGTMLQSEHSPGPVGLGQIHPLLTKVDSAGQPVVGAKTVAPLVDEVKQHRKVIEAQQKTIDDLSRRMESLEKQKKNE